MAIIKDITHSTVLQHGFVYRIKRTHAICTNARFFYGTSISYAYLTSWESFSGVKHIQRSFDAIFNPRKNVDRILRVTSWYSAPKITFQRMNSRVHTYTVTPSSQGRLNRMYDARIQRRFGIPSYASNE